VVFSTACDEDLRAWSIFSPRMLLLRMNMGLWAWWPWKHFAIDINCVMPTVQKTAWTKPTHGI